MTGVWAAIAFGLLLAVELSNISDAVRFDRRRPGAYGQLAYPERLRYLLSIGLPGFAGLTLAALSTRAARHDNWPVAELAFALEAIVLIVAAIWTRRLIRAMFGVR